ncbi:MULTISPECIES: hypothetical protein [unclassified Microcoleus]|uniref:hypothetical protein n=1 Tax=unclassified Microcoleus TaxID=2642155 RepID=UPI002FD4810B
MRDFWWSAIALKFEPERSPDLLKNSANRSEPIAASGPLHQSTEHQPTQRLLHFREQEKTTGNLLMRLLVEGTTLIVSVGV